MGRWLELRVEADAEAAEAIAELLSRCTGRGIAVEQQVLADSQAEAPPRPTGRVTIVGYLPDEAEAQGPVRQVQEGLWHLGQIWPGAGALSVRPIAEEDWANAWREHFHVTRVGRRCVVVPTWREHRPGPDEVVIALDPGMAFGTGLHPTSKLCVQALEEYLLPSMTVLDLGTGSGILAIAAAKLGADHVLALDIDAVAVGVARENVERNGLAGVIAVKRGSLELAPVGTFHLAVANLTAQVVMDVTAPLLAALRPGGLAVTSGFLQERQSEVAAALERAGGSVRSALSEGDWGALVVRRRGDV